MTKPVIVLRNGVYRTTHRDRILSEPRRWWKMFPSETYVISYTFVINGRLTLRVPLWLSTSY